MRCFQARDALLAGERGEPFASNRRVASLRVGQAAEPEQRVVQFLGVDRIGPSLDSNLRDRLRVEPAKLGGALRIVPAPRHDGLGPPLFQWRVVEKGVGSRRQRLECERRGLGQIAGNDANGARFEAREQPLEAFDVHRLVQAVR